MAPECIPSVTPDTMPGAARGAHVAVVENPASARGSAEAPRRAPVE